MTDLLVCAALGIEARALKTDGLRVERVGMGVRRAEEFARRERAFDVLAVAGFGGATDECLRPGDIVVADEVRRGGQVIECPWADSIAFALERHLILEPEVDEAPEPHTAHGLNAAGRGTPAVMTGPVETIDHIASAQILTRLAGQGVTTVDMESFPLVATARGRPFTVVRVIVDTPDHPLVRPSTLRAGLNARKRLQAIGAVLRDWATALEHV
ncbi:1-hydroxy-2-methyl-2-(E)-butenyl 4-diphosphate reductase, 4Fe-4S protein [Catenulispora acidiphila DSM 44928]|uniref:1-hydroxy-2-methyl-2-(E)-butenyl 4-diphosphate reductase, 4Fe-4S protein n=1 Tax=Catenulispora acidiphila (strain DSM 44928 / JCM 14897 / NBRC 102108 / NRRL B-24433 / ID139908) TaxID=479433 RepID=C7Q016_CATAD|nr:1-hydroxy-2-methyl-2-(E)-butenyl 4-diphosphate reductase, 4Fe-4S protein [Catenulispora acidiphila]ACU75509.1 1-hydroxy-2-methyl-2-(E)-butenyl 4-diphosphate reductase, 4Fe-4S protein [Catenulispora acidiphila DSM 44928]